MRRVEYIPEYSMEVLFSSDRIQCYDLISKEVICSKSYRERIANVIKLSFNSFQIYSKSNKLIDSIYIDLVSERSRVATGAQYIRNFFMDTPTIRRFERESYAS